MLGRHNLLKLLVVHQATFRWRRSIDKNGEASDRKRIQSRMEMEAGVMQAEPETATGYSPARELQTTSCSRRSESLREDLGPSRLLKHWIPHHRPETPTHPPAPNHTRNRAGDQLF